MAKRSAGAVLTTLSFDSQTAVPLYCQLYRRVRELILDGKLARGVRLPSSRTLADDLDLS